MAVLDAIASAKNTKPADVSAGLDTTLFDPVDPDALDTLVTKGESISISFTIDEYEVRFDGDALEITHS